MIKSHSYQDPALGGHFGIAPLQEYAHAAKPAASFGFFGILISVDSSLTIVRDGIPATINPGQFVCLSPSDRADFPDTGDGTACMITFSKDFYCVELHDEDTSCNGLLFNTAASPVVSTSEVQHQKLARLLDVISDEMEEPDDKVKTEMLRSVLKRLIILCVRAYRSNHHTMESLDSAQSDLVRQFHALVEKHFKSNHSVGEYADLLFRSPKTLSNAFTKAGLTTPLSIIHNRIALEGKRLLHYTDMSISEVSAELGFTEPTHFTRIFKKVYKQSPSAFRSSPDRAAVSQ